MDFLSIIGIATGLAAVLGGNWLEGGHLASLANGPAAVIVGGGTVGAMLLQTPAATVGRGLGMLGWLLVPPRRDFREHIRRISGWSNLARKEGLLGLEHLLHNETDPFARKGLQMLVDGNEANAIREALELDLESSEQAGLQAARIYESMGGYAPTIGIIGAVMGLIHVMQNLSDPGKLGAGIATAFVATIYGVGLANLLLLPIGNKLKAHVHAQSRRKELIIEGLIAISEGENPLNIEAKLEGFVQDE